MHLCCFEAKWPSLMLKTRPKQLIGSLPLAFALLAKILKAVGLPLQKLAWNVELTDRFMLQEKNLWSAESCGLYNKTFFKDVIVAVS
jgi:hypothetical protein